MFNNVFGSDGGWIGVDRGARALKLAQLRRVGQELELTAMAITPRWKASAGVFDAGEQCRREVEAARALGGNCKGRKAAAVTSMSLCTIDTDNNIANAATGNCVDRWQVDPSNSYTLSLPETEVNDLCQGMERAGLQCRVVDGLPLALARALTLAPNYRSDKLVAALDWGAASTTLVVARGGQAVYARKLKQSDFGLALDSIAHSLQLSESEAEKVVLLHGVLGDNHLETDLVAKAVANAVVYAVTALLGELQATLSHLEGKLKTRRPEQLWMFGMGGTVPGLPEWVGSKCKIQAAAWHPAGIVNHDATETPACLFGPAIALSALAWKANGSQR